MPDTAQFRALRERLGALVLLPASENASYRDKPLPDKLPFYARQNHLTAVLSSPAHSTNNPVLRRFDKEEGLEDVFHYFGVSASMTSLVNARSELYRRLCRRIWGADRLGLGDVEPDVKAPKAGWLPPGSLWQAAYYEPSTAAFDMRPRSTPMARYDWRVVIGMDGLMMPERSCATQTLPGHGAVARAAAERLVDLATRSSRPGPSGRTARTSCATAG